MTVAAGVEGGAGLGSLPTPRAFVPACAKPRQQALQTYAATEREFLEACPKYEVPQTKDTAHGQQTTTALVAVPVASVHSSEKVLAKPGRGVTPRPGFASTSGSFRMRTLVD